MTEGEPTKGKLRGKKNGPIGGENSRENLVASCWERGCSPKGGNFSRNIRKPENGRGKKKKRAPTKVGIPEGKGEEVASRQEGLRGGKKRQES